MGRCSLRYVGGKSRLAKHISKVILDSTDSRGLYVEPMIGGGGMLTVMAPNFDRVVAGDIDPDVILYWEGIAAGKIPSSVVTEGEYRALRADPNPSFERSHAAFNCSFSGKKWGGMHEGMGVKVQGTLLMK